jgi:hypothetical protein
VQRPATAAAKAVHQAEQQDGRRIEGIGAKFGLHDPEEVRNVGGRAISFGHHVAFAPASWVGPRMGSIVETACVRKDCLGSR